MVGNDCPLPLVAETTKMPTEFLGSHLHGYTGESSMNGRVKNTGIRWLIFAGVLAASAGLLVAAVRHATADRWAESANPTSGCVPPTWSLPTPLCGISLDATANSISSTKTFHSRSLISSGP